MQSSPSNNLKKFAEDLKSLNQSRNSDANQNFKSEMQDTQVKRFDHHLIDEDLGLEDKYGRRVNPSESSIATPPSQESATSNRKS
jgi:oligoribonuclease NrnB/cAMP/cGMP phosphodiesterase (DHH superfamily)